MRLIRPSFLVVFTSIAFAVPANAKLLADANQPVPDGGMTAILLGGALAIIAVVRHFVKR